MEKACTRCKITKPLDQFHHRAKAADGRASECAECMNARNRKFHTEHPTYKRDYYLKNRDKQLRAQKKSKFKLTDEELDILEAKTHCDACGGELQGGHWRHIDHDHETGAVRGVLCRFCNTALGFFRDNPATIRRLAEYVECR